MPEDITDILPQIGESLVLRGLTLAVMESCTGGLLSARLTSTPGCGDYFLGGAIAYATDSEARFGVPQNVIRAYGVVSAETAAAMAEAVASSLCADIGIGVTGVAGPKPQDGQPVGRVFVAIATAGNAHGERFDFGDEHPDDIKAAAVVEALKLMLRRVSVRP